jgi:hypothetical protein
VLLRRDAAWMAGQVAYEHRKRHLDGRFTALLCARDLLADPDVLVHAQAARSMARLGRPRHTVPHLEPRFGALVPTLCDLLTDPS